MALELSCVIIDLPIARAEEQQICTQPVESPTQERALILTCTHIRNMSTEATKRKDEVLLMEEQEHNSQSNSNKEIDIDTRKDPTMNQEANRNFSEPLVECDEHVISLCNDIDKTQFLNDELTLEEYCASKFNDMNSRLLFLCSLERDQGRNALEKMLKEVQSNNELDRVKKVLNLNRMFKLPRNNAALMHICAGKNNVGCIEVLHKCGALIDVVDDMKATPLFYACAKHCQEALVYLLSNGANPNHKDRYGGHSLQVCLRNGYLDLIKILILYKANINLRNQRGNTCLHLACTEGHMEKTKFLLESCEASVMRMNRDDEHVLFSALPHSTLTEYICNYLNAKQLNTALSKINIFGKTVFHICCEMGYLNTLTILMKALLAKNESNKDKASEFLTTRINENDTIQGYTPLHYAILNSRIDVVKFLLSIRGININSEDIHGDTALHLAIQMRNTSVCDMLIEYGASVRAKNKKSIACWKLAYELGVKLNTSEISTLQYLWYKKSTLRGLKKKMVSQVSA
jgi:ankyrin repeat protein